MLTFLQVMAVILSYELGKATYRAIKRWWMKKWSFGA